MAWMVRSGLLVSTVVLAVLTACGGGGGGGSTTTSDTGAGATSTVLDAPPATGTPNATIAGTQADAEAVADISADGAQAAAVASSVSGVGWLAVPTSVAVPAGAMASVMAVPASSGVGTGTTVCASAGTYDIQPDFITGSEANPAVGDGYVVVYTGCQGSGGVTLDGTLDARFKTFTSYDDYVLSLTYTDWLSSYAGSSSLGPTSRFTGLYTHTIGGDTFSYLINDVTVVGQPTLSASGAAFTVLSGQANHFVGTTKVAWVTVVYSNWKFDAATGQPLSGQATVTGADGAQAIVIVTTSSGITSYNVSITDDSGTHTFTVSASAL